MTESFASLHVLGATSDGKVLHTLRSPTAWTDFTPIPNLPGPAVDVACVRRVPVPPETAPLTQGLWAFIAFENSQPELRFRNAGTAQWEGPVPISILPLPIATRVAVTVSPGVAPANDPTNPGGPRAYVHLAVVANGGTPQDQGRLIAAIMPNRGAGGVSSAIAEVQTSGAGDLGRAQAVALAPAAISPWAAFRHRTPPAGGSRSEPGTWHPTRTRRPAGRRGRRRPGELRAQLQCHRPE